MEIQLETRDSHLHEHQRLCSWRFGEAGAVSGVLAEATDNGRLYWCAWTLLKVPTKSILWRTCWTSALSFGIGAAACCAIQRASADDWLAAIEGKQ